MNFVEVAGTTLSAFAKGTLIPMVLDAQTVENHVPGGAIADITRRRNAGNAGGTGTITE